MASFVDKEKKSAENKSFPALAAWRLLNAEGYTMPSNVLLTDEQEREVTAQHNTSVATAVALLRTNSEGHKQTSEGESKTNGSGTSTAPGANVDRTYECMSCMEDFVHINSAGVWQNGVLCHGTGNDAPHFIGTDCFRRHIAIDACQPGGRFEADFAVRNGTSAPGDFPCPAASLSGCDDGALNIQDIYRVCLGHDSSFQHFTR